jgi:RNA polymerase sigma-70 factor (ECF subfamily)
VSPDLIFLLTVATVLLRQPEDAGLIARLKQRDPDAMAELYDRYGRVVYAIIVRIVRDRALAEDLAQEVFLRVWNRAGSFDPERGALGPWVLTIARNQAVDYMKSLQGRAWKATETADSERLAAFADIEGEYLDSVRLQRVRTALESLNEQQRRVLELAYFEGLSQTETAARIQQPLGTVKTWTRSALKVLREQLAAPAAI